MTLSEVAYQIDGELKIETVNDQGAVYKATLLDNMRDPAIVKYRGDHTRPSDTEAIAIGMTESEALQKLVDLLKGNILEFRFPIMWTDYSQILRIPITLTVDSVVPARV